MRDATCMHDSRADIVDELILNQILAIPDGVEDLTDGERRNGVLADQAKGVLVFGGRRILHPEQAKRLQGLAQARGLDRREPMVHVVQKMMPETQLLADASEKFGRVIEIFL